LKKERKIELAKRLAEQLEEAKLVIAAEYAGLTVAEMESIRNTVKEQGYTFNVIKNRIVKKAIEGSRWEAIADYLTGPNAFALCFDDPVALAKVLVDKSKEFKKLKIKFGCLDGRVIEAKEIETLSKLPSKEVLLAQLLGTMKAPITGFVNVLAANLRQLLYVLKAIEEKKKEGN